MDGTEAAPRLPRLRAGAGRGRGDLRALRKLALLNAAGSLDVLRVVPGNRLEMLSGDRAGQHSIRINEQYRVCFVWKGGDAYHVEVTDYH